MINEMVLDRTSNLVMPLHYVELTEEEMAYVDGGGISTQTFATIIDCSITAISLVCTVVGAFKTMHALGRISKGLVRNILKKSAKSALINMVKSAGWAFGFTVTSATISAAYDIANEVFDFSVGGLLAKIIDKADGCENGICFG